MPGGRLDRDGIRRGTIAGPQVVQERNVRNLRVGGERRLVGGIGARGAGDGGRHVGVLVAGEPFETRQPQFGESALLALARGLDAAWLDEVNGRAPGLFEVARKILG